MPFTNRSELRSAILAELGFTGGEIAESVVNDWIALCDGDIGRRVRPVGRQLTADVTVSTDLVDLPGGFRQVVDFYLAVTPRLRLMLRPIQQVRAMQAVLNNGPPRYFAVKSDSTLFTVLVVAPIPDQSYTGKLTYWKAQELVDDVTAAHLLVRYPDLYLYGSLIHGATYLGENERIPIFEDLYYEAVAAVNAAENADWQSDQGAAA